ncbi:hypothetical protein ONS95_003373 [Cadophora gregata]|uniref:uncharacterized protein n=1 Tax=Cadophora gregata TaxID=51156 RepID=UPI0026DD0C39|nr:uncharacterized protein ONS95_003373 [Cadophora gregata]KAK0108575.1 hypothetical protein ONS95_003373 [Cadophora gregata]
MADKPIHYDDIEGVEDLFQYKADGFHPVVPGVTFDNDRYTITNKLGHGSYSTVWIAKDQVSNRFVALKIQRADVSLVHAEWKLVQRLQDKHDNIEGADQGRKFLVLPEDSFEIVGINDLHSGNIFLKLPKMTTSEMMDKFGSPVLEDVERLDGKPLTAHVPSTATVAVDYPDASQFSGDIVIGDFGSAFSTSPTTTTLESPVVFNVRITNAAPEVLVRCEEIPIGLPSDIWSLGCLIVFLLSGKELFEDWFASEKSITADIVKLLGSSPPSFVRAWESKNVILKSPAEGTHDALENRLEELLSMQDSKINRMDVEERGMIIDLLKRIFRWEDQERPSIDEVKSHAWSQGAQQ